MTTLEFRNVTKSYTVRGARGGSRKLLAVNDVSFTLESGKTVALVGQSGSGKSTIAKLLMQIERPTQGEILLDGKPIQRRGHGLREYRSDVQMVFQDPFASLNPYHTVEHHLARPLQIHGHARSAEEVEKGVRRRAYVAGRRRVECRAIFEEELFSARVQQDPGGHDRHRHRLACVDGAGFERHHDRFGIAEIEIRLGNTDHLDRPHALSRQR